MTRLRLWLGAIVLLVLAGILGGCFQLRQELTLMSGERWEARMEMTVPASVVSMMGEAQRQELEAEGKREQERLQAQGISAQVSTRKTDQGDYILSVQVAGQGWELLNRAVFTGTARIEPLGERLRFSYDPSKQGEMALSSLYQFGGKYTFVLNAGTIYSSNATKVSGGTATWENPTGEITAEVGLGGGGMPLWLIIVLVIVGVILLAAVALFFWLRRPRAAKGPLCPQCGAPVAPDAAFCTRCGAKIS
ncbi:MAG: zinc-ribbon domain-containing protein [Chloroflexia bacterium]